MTPGTADPVSTGWWQRMVPWWHVAFAATVAVTGELALARRRPLRAPVTVARQAGLLDG